MKARLLLSLLLAVTPMVGMATEESMNLHEIGEAIRDGQLDVGDEYSIDRNQGRLHAIHADEIGMECTSCHKGTTYRADYLLVGKDVPYPKRAKGQYDRTVCLGCHREGGEASAFYGTAATGSE